MNNWVVIASYSAEPEAYIAAGMLRSNGIDVQIGADHMTTLYGAGSTWAPVTLSVPQAQAPEALDLLTDHDDNR